MSEPRPRLVRRAILGNALLALAFVVAAKLAALAANEDAVTAIWPVAGMTLAALMRFGYRAWIGIAVGALVDGFTAGLPAGAALGVAIANFASPLGSYWLLRRSIGDRGIFETSSNMFRFLGWGGAAGATAAASIGATSLCLAGGVPWSNFLVLWWPWWLGDLVGVIAFAPALLQWRGLFELLRARARILEGLALVASFWLAGWLTFDLGRVGPATFIPLLVWSVFRFGAPGAAYSALAVTLLGVDGAFRGEDATASLLRFQSLVAALTGTNLVLAAVVSERSRARREIAQQNQTLEQRVAEQTRILTSKNEELKSALASAARRAQELTVSDQRSRALLNELEAAQESLLRQERLATLGELAGSVGHEIRNPLGAISNSVYYLRMSLTAESPKVEQHLELISNAIRRADGIVTELLDFARQPATRIGTCSVVEAASKALAEVTVPPSVDVSFVPGGDSLLVAADMNQIRGILGNLIRNAVEAMPKGGGLTVRCSLDGDRVMVEVEDTGVGIANDDLEKVFEPLVTGKATGIGLGLAVSRRYASLNGGRLECESELGQGSVFRLWLPAVRGQGEGGDSRQLVAS